MVIQSLSYLKTRRQKLGDQFASTISRKMDPHFLTEIQANRILLAISTTFSHF